MHYLHYNFVLFHVCVWGCELEWPLRWPACLCMLSDVRWMLGIQSAYLVLYSSYHFFLSGKVSDAVRSYSDMLYLCVVVVVVCQAVCYDLEFAYVVSLHAPFALISRRFHVLAASGVQSVLWVCAVQNHGGMCCSSLDDARLWVYHVVLFALVDWVFVPGHDLIFACMKRAF